MTLDFNTPRLPPIPKISLSPYEWCKHHFRILTKTESRLGPRYRMRCPHCFLPEMQGQAGVGRARAVEQWGDVRVKLAVDFDTFACLSAHDRFSIVRQLVFRVNYEEHLSSHHWHEKREAVLERAKGLCERCGAAAEHVHHKTYERLGNESLEDLEALCRPCHFQEHGRVF